jgi:hypothetical protein
MKKVILTAVLLMGALQADNIVHYDKQEAEKPNISKPNYPSSDIYTK